MEYLRRKEIVTEGRIGKKVGDFTPSHRKLTIDLKMAEGVIG